MVWRRVSMIQPSVSLRVFQLPSPCRSFLRETASFRCASFLEGLAST
jgi:hypothetical protein